MAASDKTYRNQRLLDIVFGASCLLMLVGIVAMFAQDYFRPYKVESRDFRDVESAIYERQMLDLVPDEHKQQAIQEAEKQLADARQARDQKAAETAPQRKSLTTQSVRAAARAQSLKADYDSKVSLYNIDVEKRDAAAPGTREYQSLAARAESRAREVADLKQQLDRAQAEVDALTEQLDGLRRQQKADDDRVSKAEDRLKTLTSDFDRFAKLAVKQRWKLGDWIRQLPVIDAFASPTRIQQVTLNDLPIDYSFKQVTRFDRCTTCHLGIDRKAFGREALRGLREEPSAEEREKLKIATNMLAERRKTLNDKEGLDPKDLRLTRLPPKVLTDVRINEYCAHPRLDLFVDGNSPHPAEKFGCTICHGGQGSATEFLLASHTPNDAPEQTQWERRWHWEPNHFWDFPMLPARFVESSCLKCHHQVTDLLPDGEASSYEDGRRREAPGAKVVRGYNLLRENGCFGCHEIAGLKNGRWIGPDLRLEPPLDALNPDGSPKGAIDPANPPGTMRKVGPNLARISEKTNPAWAADWIRAPRDFRPTTKMPHFYGLSNNNREALEGTGQEEFPDTEIQSIVSYLFQESERYVKGLPASLRLPDPPPETKNLAEGRRLFTERGCLACHSHDATAQLMQASGQAALPAVKSDAVFGPNLSRLSAKLGVHPNSPAENEASARRWLTQWIQDPKVYHPRTFMPVTHLTREEAAAVADWLLSQPSDWQVRELPPAKTDTLKAMARIWLEKSMMPDQAGRLLDANGQLPPATKEGELSEFEEWAAQHPGADENRLIKGEGRSWDDNLKWYVGKKAISQLGCFGCHNIPGFENAKPIGTPLNDWGKKDPERLAFEDVVAYVDRHHQRVETPAAAKDIHGHEVEYNRDQQDTNGAAHFRDPLKECSGSYEEYFYDSLAHHRRDGFLYQKLREPRSFDYNRVRTWDDRLRMPQFQFARGDAKPLEGESEEQTRAREEAEAREAVMTFVLGLVADQVPSRYVYDPIPDKKAVARGKQVLDKFNCAGCHQLQSGVYSYSLLRKSTPDQPSVLEALESAAQDPGTKARKTYPEDHRWDDHNAWAGLPQPAPDRVRIDAIPAEKDAQLAGYALPEASEDELTIRLTRALRFTKRPQDVRNPEDADELPAGTYDIPAAEPLKLRKADLVLRADPHGGKFVELLVPYLIKRPPRPDLNDNPGARSGLPPPLLREGEKTQPDWLFRFLRNPIKLREVTILRMPRFNMSDEEAMALVNYFGAVDRLSNPGINLHFPYLLVPERDEGYLAEQSAIYAQRMNDDHQQGRTFVGDAYRLMTAGAPLTICLNCHQVGDKVDQRVGPKLDYAPDRLRPDWTVRWIASPQRLLVYPIGSHPMPQAFPANKMQYQQLFEGTSTKEQEAARQQYEAAERRLKEARAALARETEPEQRKAAEAALQAREKELAEAHQALARYSLNQSRALRDILMNLPEVEISQGNRGAAAQVPGESR